MLNLRMQFASSFMQTPGSSVKRHLHHLKQQICTRNETNRRLGISTYALLICTLPICTPCLSATPLEHMAGFSRYLCILSFSRVFHGICRSFQPGVVCHASQSLILVLIRRGSPQLLHKPFLHYQSNPILSTPSVTYYPLFTTHYQTILQNKPGKSNLTLTVVV